MALGLNSSTTGVVGGVVGAAAGSIVNKVLMWAVAVMAIFIVTAGTLGYYHYKGLLKQIETLQVERTTYQLALMTAQDANEKLQAQIDLQQELIEASRIVANEHADKIAELTDQVADLKNKLPKTLPRANVPKDTPQQKEQAAQRIGTIWSVYCLDSKNKGCTNETNR